MRCPSVLVLLTLGVAATVPASAGQDPFAFFADGASAVEIEGSGTVPMLRGADTAGMPAVLAQGQEKDEPDEFLLKVRMASGPNSCTEPVAKALGGTIEDYVLGSGSSGGKNTKISTKGASIPELRLKGADGTIVIRDWHCEVHPSENALSVPSLSEAAVALLADEGTFTFAASGDADALLAKVGTPIQASKLSGGVFYNEGKLVTTVGTELLLSGTAFGKESAVVLSTDDGGKVEAAAFDLPFKSLRGGSFYTAGPVTVGDLAIEDTTFLTYDRPLRRAWSPDGDKLEVSVALGYDQLFDVSIAVDGATGRVALARVDEATWTGSGAKMIEDAKKQFDKNASASLLQPFAPETAVAMATGPVCTGEPRLNDASFQTRDGVRYFGAAAVGVEPSNCVEPKAERVRSRLDNGASPKLAEGDMEEGGSEGTSDGVDTKEAQRLADYADVLWKNGRYAEALGLYDQAKDLAGEDCSYFQDFAQKALLLGRTEDAHAAAIRSAELYEPWAAQSLEIRLDVQEGRDVPEGTITKAQSHDCYVARGIQAQAALARGAHKEVEQLYVDHMELDQNLAQALALSRLQRGQSSRARGPALQALEVGGRGDADMHATHGVVAARGGSERLLDANLDRLHAMPALDTETALTGVAMARTRSEAKVTAFVDRLVAERPDAAAAWTAYALAARRRGDSAAYAKAQAKADGLARDTVERNAGSLASWCDGAELLAATGKVDQAKAYVSKAGGLPEGVSACPVADAILAATAGDAQGTTNALQDVARRRPGTPLGTLGLVQPLPAPKAE